MNIRRLISVLLIAIYAIIIGHDVMSHHHHHESTACQISNHPNLISDHNHNGCSHTNDCGFPFHQHSMDEAGVFRNNANLEIKFDKFKLSPLNLFDNENVVFYTEKSISVDFITPVCKGPELSSESLRGPPIV